MYMLNVVHGTNLLLVSAGFLLFGSAFEESEFDIKIL